MLKKVVKYIFCLSVVCIISLCIGSYLGKQQSKSLISSLNQNQNINDESVNNSNSNTTSPSDDLASSDGFFSISAQSSQTNSNKTDSDAIEEKNTQDETSYSSSSKADSVSQAEQTIIPSDDEIIDNKQDEAIVQPIEENNTSTKKNEAISPEQGDNSLIKKDEQNTNSQEEGKDAVINNEKSNDSSMQEDGQEATNQEVQKENNSSSEEIDSKIVEEESNAPSKENVIVDYEKIRADLKDEVMINYYQKIIDNQQLLIKITDYINSQLNSIKDEDLANVNQDELVTSLIEETRSILAQDKSDYDAQIISNYLTEQTSVIKYPQGISFEGLTYQEMIDQYDEPIINLTSYPGEFEYMRQGVVYYLNGVTSVGDILKCLKDDIDISGYRVEICNSLVGSYSYQSDFTNSELKIDTSNL